MGAAVAPAHLKPGSDRREAVAEKQRDGGRHADVEARTRSAPVPVVAVHDGRGLGGELQQARREIEIEVRERVRNDAEHSLRGDYRAPTEKEQETLESDVTDRGQSSEVRGQENNGEMSGVELPGARASEP